MLRRLLPLLAVAGLLLRASPASAESSPEDLPPASSEESARTQWYGWQTLLADAASVELVGLGIAAGGSRATPLLVYSGLGTFALGGPIVHAAHGRWGIAGADLGLRVGGVMTGVIVGGLIGRAATSGSCGHSSVPVDDIDDCSGTLLGSEVEGALIGTVIGTVAASAIDASVFAHTNAAHSDDSFHTASLSWSPTISPSRNGASASIVGTF